MGDARFKSTSTYGITGGALLLGTRRRDPPTWTTNPQLGTPTFLFRRSQVSRIKNLEWKGFRLGTEILDFALTAYEVDLKAVLTACVFPARLVCPEFDFLKAPRTCVVHLRT